MSGFSAEWLRLREDADHRARSRALLRRTAALFAGRDSLRIADLGCGTGSNLRAMALLLPERQAWRLVDHDSALLAAAREALSGWADRAAGAGDRLTLFKQDRIIEVSLQRGDLARDLAAILAEPADLVTAAALIDLTSAAWLARLAHVLAQGRTPFYATLAYDGEETWTPAHPHDGAIRDAFHAHQARDKGFGPAAGPRAADVLAEAFARAGYGVERAASPWRLGTEDAALISELVRGIASAAAETGAVDETVIREWREARLAGVSCVIGHTDLLAAPRN